MKLTRISPLAVICIYLSGIFALFGIIFLTLLYIGLFTGQESLNIFGPLNDLFSIFHFALTLPTAFVLHMIFRDEEPRLSTVALGLNILGVSVVVLFQTLLVTGVMTFMESLVFVLIGGVLFGGWILIVGKLGRETRTLSISRSLSGLAILYVGYPMWAFRVGRFIQNKPLKPHPAPHVQD